jgi:hypothetical protein
MKRSLILSLVLVAGLFVACGKAGSYADDAYKAVKNHVDDIKPKSKGHGFHKCRQCDGTGVYYNGEDCPNCVGGYVYE